MADVTEAFLRGHQAGQSEREHDQALEENKLRTLVLKHQIDSLKIEDQIRARNLALQNAQLLHGQPAADLPTEDVTKPNLPSSGLAGVVSGLVRARQGQVGNPMEALQGAAPVAAAAPTDGADPSFMAAPAAQAATPGTHTVQQTRAVQIPGAAGVPGISIRPQSMEDIVRASIASEMAKPYTLAPDARRFVGATEISRGGSKNVVVPRGGTLANEGTGAVVATGQPAAKRTRPVTGRMNGKDAFATYDPDTDRYTINGKDVTGAFQPRPTAEESGATDREAQRRWTNAFRQYLTEISGAQKQHAEAFRTWQKANETAMPGQETPAPVYTPPSFDEWQAAHPEAGDAKGGKPAAAPATTPAAPTPVKQPTDPLHAADPKSGQVFKFPSKAAADAFRKEMGIK